MSDEIGIRFEEPETGEGGEVAETSERAEAQTLDDAALEPGARVELAGDHRQSEAIEAVLGTIAIEEDDTVRAQQPLRPEQLGELRPADSDDDDDDDDDDRPEITPINLPAPVGEAAQRGLDEDLPST